MSEQRVDLPLPAADGEKTVEETIEERRSHRDFASQPLTLQQVSRLLWAAQGVTAPQDGFRACPSAGATFPLEVFTAVGKRGVQGLEQGVFRYVPADHELARTGADDIRSDIASAALGQNFVATAPVGVLLAAQSLRTTMQYGERGRRYVHMEAGHASQNIYLQAESLGLVTVAVGAFREEPMSRIYGLPQQLDPLYLMPVGHPASAGGNG